MDVTLQQLHWGNATPSEQKECAHEIDRLRAELEAAKLVIDEARKQVPVVLVHHIGIGGTVHGTLRKGSDAAALTGALLYAAPVPQPTVPEAVAKDAERYRWLRSRNVGSAKIWEVCDGHSELMEEDRLDAAIDAAILSSDTNEVGNEKPLA